MQNRPIAFLLILLASSAVAAEPLSPRKALTLAFQANPEIAAADAKSDSEHAAIRAAYAPENPRIGLMQEKNWNLMEQQMGQMTAWTVSQEIKFPVKYFLMGAAQGDRADEAKEAALAKKLEIRRKVLSAYFSLFSINRILALQDAQRETLREIARIAEARHATGAVAQQDEMKAHVEQTRVENEILETHEEKENRVAALSALLGSPEDLNLKLPETELAAPKAKSDLSGIGKSPLLRQARHSADAASSEKTLAVLGYVPDFMLSYRHAVSSAPIDNYSFSVELSIPLWFFARQSGEAGAASARSAAAERNFDMATANTAAEIRSLASKVRGHAKLLQIYETALIPQASTVLNSSRAAYRAGKVGFLELLDSERSIYSVQIAYYRTLAEYVEALAMLEEKLGESVSDLPFGETS